MRISLTNTQRLENWLLRKGSVDERLLTEAYIQLDPQLKEEAKWQERTYQLVKEYGRQQLIEEIQGIETQLFTAPKHQNFRARIRSIFTK